MLTALFKKAKKCPINGILSAVREKNYGLILKVAVEARVETTGKILKESVRPTGWPADRLF
jgi:uncharacterized alpha/beta hydrolase family protein